MQIISFLRLNWNCQLSDEKTHLKMKNKKVKKAIRKIQSTDSKILNNENFCCVVSGQNILNFQLSKLPHYVLRPFSAKLFS